MNYSKMSDKQLKDYEIYYQIKIKYLLNKLNNDNMEMNNYDTI